MDAISVVFWPKVLQIHTKGHLLEPLFRPEIQMLRAWTPWKVLPGGSDERLFKRKEVIHKFVAKEGQGYLANGTAACFWKLFAVLVGRF